MPAIIRPTVVTMSRKISDGSYGTIEFGIFVTMDFGEEGPDPTPEEKAEAVKRAYRTAATLIAREQEARGIVDPLVRVSEQAHGKPVQDMPPVQSAAQRRQEGNRG